MFAVNDADNRMRWDRATPGRYEVWYLTLSDRAGRAGFWIRYTLEAPLDGPAYAQLWFAFFDAASPAKSFALNRKFPIAELGAKADPFEIAIGAAKLTHASAKGELAGDGHTARWDLTWLPAAETHRQLPDLVYRTTFADTTLLTPNLDVPVRGTIVADGRTFTLQGEPGGQTHIWGRKHAHSWAWGHCNAFEGRRGAALEAFTARLKRGVVLPPVTLLTLYLDGEALRFNRFGDLLRTRGHMATGRYAFSASNATARIEGEFTTTPEDMTLAEYEDPDGERAYCANTEIADLRVKLFRRRLPVGRWQPAGELFAPRTAHFEVAGRTPDPAVQRRHVLT
jgi:hypothetical protein